MKNAEFRSQIADVTPLKSKISSLKSSIKESVQNNLPIIHNN